VGALTNVAVVSIFIYVLFIEKKLRARMQVYLQLNSNINHLQKTFVYDRDKK